MTEDNPANELTRQLMGLSSLIQLENKSRQTETIAEFGFFIVNETRRLLNYHQAVFFKNRSNRLLPANISGVPDYEKNAPYVKWLRKLAAKTLRKQQLQSPSIFQGQELPENLQKGWQEWSGGAGIWCPFVVNRKLLGGLWLTRDNDWQEAEVGLLKQLSTSYAYSLYALTTRTKWWNPEIHIHIGKAFIRIALLAAMTAALFIPVQLSVLAPAKVAAVDPLIVTSPLNAVVKQIHVRPNQQVKKGQLLFTLDDTELRNRYNVAGKTLEVVEAEYRKSRQQSLLMTDKGSDADLLKAKIKSKEAEVKFTLEKLALVDVRAEKSGIVLFNDPNDWLGKPVAVGEKILILADPDKNELEIHIPVENAVNLEPGAKVRMFLNIDPTREINAEIYRTSYEAEISEERILSFQVKARFASGTAPVRIGYRGTAKIFGKEVPLYYYLLRRPLAKVRRTLGV